jgi:hypothetical protein
MYCNRACQLHSSQPCGRTLRGFCTHAHAPPRLPNQHGRVKPQPQQDLLQHIRDTVEIFDADGAADEQKAGRFLGGDCRQVAGFFHNMKALVRDRTHAAARPSILVG